jgi:hypothetical protein
MSRPKLKSDPIAFRVDMALWPFLVARAEAKGLTPSQYVQSVIEPALKKDLEASK